jgi:hypothetical protein
MRPWDGGGMIQPDFFGKRLAQRAEFSGHTAPSPKEDHHMKGAAFWADALDGVVASQMLQEFFFIDQILSVTGPAILIAHQFPLSKHLDQFSTEKHAGQDFRGNSFGKETGSADEFAFLLWLFADTGSLAGKF